MLGTILEEKSLPAASEKILTEEKQQQSSVVRPAFNASTPLGKFSTQAQICSPTFTNISAIKKKDDQPRDVRRMLAAPEDFDESFISLSKINNISSSSSGKSRESIDKADPVETRRPTEKLLETNFSWKNEQDKDKESSNLKQVFSLYIWQNYVPSFQLIIKVKVLKKWLWEKKDIKCKEQGQQLNYTTLL